MKFRPGGGLHPATDAARSAARTAQPVPRTYGRPPPDEIRVGRWRLLADEHGDLVAEHMTKGVRRVLARLDEHDSEREDES